MGSVKEDSKWIQTTVVVKVTEACTVLYRKIFVVENTLNPTLRKFGVRMAWEGENGRRRPFTTNTAIDWKPKIPMKQSLTHPQLSPCQKDLSQHVHFSTTRYIWYVLWKSPAKFTFQVTWLLANDCVTLNDIDVLDVWAQLLLSPRLPQFLSRPVPCDLLLFPWARGNLLSGRIYPYRKDWLFSDWRGPTNGSTLSIHGIRV